MKQILIHCAMEKEGLQLVELLELNKISDNIYRKENRTLIITGIGKQITAIEMTKYLENNTKPDLIINVGYAGSTNVPIGKWISVSKSFNMEWDILGEEKYERKDMKNIELKTVDELDKLPCYSAECFVTKTEIKGDILFDMELNSLALICELYGIELSSLKKVSDHLSLDKYYDNLDNRELLELKSSIKYINELENN